jgi:hypothetical protein
MPEQYPPRRQGLENNQASARQGADPSLVEEERKSTVINEITPESGRSFPQSDLLCRMVYLSIPVLLSILFSPPAIYAETLILHPSGKSGSVASNANWVFSPSGASNEAIDLDSNDSDSTYASSTTAGSTITLYMDLDDPSLTGWTINSVQVVAVARKTGSDTNIAVGHRVGSTDYTTSRSVRSTSYRTYLGPLHTTNPSTGAAWNWTDINNLIAIAVHSGSSSNPLRVTELFVKVDYSKSLLPSGKNPLTTGWVFTGAEATALDGNDGDTSYAQSTALNDKLYIDLDNFPAATAIITGIQLHVVARCTVLPCNLEVGVRTNGADFVKSFDAVTGAGTIYSGGGTAIKGNATSFQTQLGINSQITAMGQTRTVTAVSDSNDLTVNTAFSPQLPNDKDSAVPFTFIGGTLSYQRFTSDFFTRNPATLAPWSWSDINNLIGVVNHVTNANGLRVTQVYLSINTIVPVVLGYSPDAGYGSADGLHPDSGGITSPFTYKIVYTNLNNNPPTSIKVHIDGDGGHDMIRDANAEEPDFRDLDYSNGEQYTYTVSSLSAGPHTYYFSATDGTDSAQKPIPDSLTGPGVAIAAGTLDVFPSGENIGTFGDWGFNGASASTALDTSDGNTSYVDHNANERGEYLYLDMDDPGLTGPSITSVQVSAVMCSPNSSASVRLGLRLNGTDYVSSRFSVAVSSSCGTYTTYTPATALFATNPDTGKAWNWQDINDMIGVVVNESTNDVWTTQFKVSVVHSPVGLSFAEDPGYVTDGVNPDSGNNTTTFTYKVIYSNANGTTPAAGYPKVHIDGNATGVAMTLDTSAADPTLYDGDYVDGEQYTYTAPAGYTAGTHTYYFDASDGAATVRFPVAGNYSGPAISLPAGTFTLFPSDMTDGTIGWTFCNDGDDSKNCSDPKTALDTNDSDSSYARSRLNGEDLFMSLDDPKYNGQFITSVQVKAVARHESGAANFTLGVYTVAEIAESATLTTTSTTYATYSGTVYTVNPMTNLPWTWVDLENLIAVVRHKDNDRIRVTQLFVEVNYGPVRLQNPSEVGYVIDGLNPSLGNTATSFKFKTVYYHVNNVAPAAGYPKVHIDGNATGIAMSLDTAATDATLRDGNYSNGEQYVYTTTMAQGSHNYYFTASDGTNTARTPGGTATYSGPDVALNGAAPNLAPSGKSTGVTTTGWTFTGSDTTALDGNDGDTSYARSVVNGDRLYMDFDDPATFPDALSIRAVQLFAVARDISSTTTTGFDFGLRLGDDDYLSGVTKTPPDAYGAAIAGAIYTTNPATGENWTWNDIKGIRAVIVHQTNNNEVRVTQLYLTVTYSPIQLTYSTDPRYFDDGVDPNGGITTTSFNYRIVYTQAFGLAPAAGYPKVHIDGNAGGIAMTLDAQAPAELRDGDYTNGEQYLYTTTLAAQGAPHNYYFDASDGTNTTRTPLSGTLSGPVVSASVPTLSFPSQTGYAVQSAGTGTLATSGTNTVTGTGTSFTTQLQVGTTITAADGQTRTVTAIASDTSLTTDTPFSPNLSGTSFTYAVWSGTGTLTTSGTTTVTGSGTSFTTQLQVGSTITAGGQTRKVMAIAGPGLLTVDAAFSPNLSSTSFTFATDLPLRGVEPNVGNVNTLFVFKVIYTDADNNPPVTGYPRLLLDYNTVVYAMSLDTAAAASLKDGNYTNGEQYTVTVNISNPGTHAYSFDATDGVTPVFWPLNGDDFLAPSITDSVSSGVIIYPASRNSQTYGFTFQGSDQDPSTALDAGYPGDGAISNAAASTTVTGVGTNFTAMSVGSILTAGAPAQTRRVTAIANDTSLTVDTAFSPNLSGVSWVFDGDISYARATNSGHKLYMNMDDVSRGTSVITSVQFFAVLRDKDAHDQTFKVGLKIGGTDYTTNYATNNNSNYVTYAHPGSAYITNPKTGQAWTWSDIDSLIGVVICTSHCHSSDELRVTQMYIKVNYNSLPTLSYSPEGGYYGTDGVDPDGWNPNHIFTYKVVYASGANFAPTSLKVFIDGDAGHEMIHDGAFITNDPLRNGDYTDGEQFAYSTAVNGLAVGPHNYYFLASDGSNTYRLPTSGTLFGPNVSVNEPFLTFSSQAGYITDGVDPNSGASASQTFTYKVVYTHPDNNPPLSVKVHIDGDLGRLMILDSSAAAALRDGNYINGEQYTYGTTLPLGSHTYFFQATDGAKQVFLPILPPAVLSGPTVTDSSAPSAITDLAIGARGTTSTTLTWTAPGNASTGAGCPCGTVVSYKIRYSTLKIVDDAATPGVGEIRFSDATAFTPPPTPLPAGSIQSVTVTGLLPNTPYYLAIKSVDEVPLTSPLSNVVNAASNPPIPSTNLLSGWNMVSVPMTPSPADVATVFGSSVGIPVNVRKWVSTGSTNQTGSFVTLSATDTVQPGIGYFLESPDDTRFLNPAGSANAAATFSISLQQGWNMVGNPYTKDVRLDATCVGRNGGTGTCTAATNDANFKSYANAVGAGWVANSLYRWDGNSYTFRTYNDPDPTLKAVLQLWQGYWLQVADANPANTYSLVVVKP